MILRPEAMELMYGPILKRWEETENNPIGLLLPTLRSIVHLSDFLYDVIRNVPGHPFSMIPLLQNPALLARLKEHVTTRPSVAMKIATGGRCVRALKPKLTVRGSNHRSRQWCLRW